MKVLSARLKRTSVVRIHKTDLKENTMPEARGLLSHFVLIIAVILFGIHANAQELSPELRGKIDKLATDALAQTGVPSASIAVVKDGKIVY
jgi:hypothetical protein